MNEIQIKKFDAVDFLNTHEEIELYLSEALSEGGSQEFIQAILEDVERAKAKLEKREAQTKILSSLFEAIQKSGKKIIIT